MCKDINSYLNWNSEQITVKTCGSAFSHKPWVAGSFHQIRSTRWLCCVWLGWKHLCKTNGWKLNMDPFGKAETSTQIHPIFGFHYVCFRVTLTTGVCLNGKSITRWWFQTFFIFIPIWGRFLIWRAYFSDGWFNHLPDKDFSPSRKISMDTFLPFRDHEVGASIAPVFFPEKPETPPPKGVDSQGQKFSKGPRIQAFFHS